MKGLDLHMLAMIRHRIHERGYSAKIAYGESPKSRTRRNSDSWLIQWEMLTSFDMQAKSVCTHPFLRFHP